MKAKKRQKLCFNCEGEVDLDVIVCPFCAADLRQEQERTTFSSTAHSVKQLHTEQSLYPPPYSKPAEEETLPPLNELPIVEEEQPSSSKQILLAIALVTFGVQCLILALLMLFGSHQGVLILKWNAHSWFVYFFASFPLLYFGYRFLNKLPM